MTQKKFQVLVLNQISPLGLKRLPNELYNVAKDVAKPDAVLVRSHDMHESSSQGMHHDGGQ